VENCLYKGEVVHRRLRPVKHQLRYRVFDLFVDVDRLDALAAQLKLLSYNRFNLFTIDDRDHGPGDGTSISEHVWSLVHRAGADANVSRIFMFCYPRVLGYVFNPLTVYYCFGPARDLRLMIYEVNNTFGGRHSYVIPVMEQLSQSAPKRFFVSPFNAVEGDYRFRFTAPAERLALGIALTVDGEPVLNAYVSAKRLPLRDLTLLRCFFSIPLLTVKVIASIHWQAALLWWKGLRLKKRPVAENPSATINPQARRAP
jgi:uncharacterized protein